MLPAQSIWKLSSNFIKSPRNSVTQIPNASTPITRPHSTQPFGNFTFPQTVVAVHKFTASSKSFCRIWTNYHAHLFKPNASTWIYIAVVKRFDLMWCPLLTKFLWKFSEKVFKIMTCFYKIQETFMHTLRVRNSEPPGNVSSHFSP